MASANLIRNYSIESAVNYIRDIGVCIRTSDLKPGTYFSYHIAAKVHGSCSLLLKSFYTTYIPTLVQAYKKKISAYSFLSHVPKYGLHGFYETFSVLNVFNNILLVAFIREPICSDYANCSLNLYLPSLRIYIDTSK